eukprot:gene4040-6105_t
MISEQPSKTTRVAEQKEDPQKVADLQKVETLKQEVSKLKSIEAAKKAEIGAIEKEAGLTPWVLFQTKMAPVKQGALQVGQAISSAAEKAVPVIKKAGSQVVDNTRSLVRKATGSSTKAAPEDTGATPAATVATIATDAGGAAPTANDDSDAPATPATSAASEEFASAPSSPTAAGPPSPSADADTGAAAAEDGPAAAGGAGAAADATGDAEEKAVAAAAAEEAAAAKLAAQQAANEKIAVIKVELTDLATQIRNKTSEISWLEKKCGVDNSVLKKITVAVTPGPRAEAVKQGLGTAGSKVAEKAKMGWGAFSAGASRLKEAAKARLSKSGTAGSSNSSDGDGNGAAAAGKDDMYDRYA